MIICHNTQSHKEACGTIQGCAINIKHYYINVVCIPIVMHWGTNWGCGGIDQRNMVYRDCKFTLIIGA